MVTNLRFEVPVRSILCIPQKSPPHTIEHVFCVFEIGVDLVLVFVGFGLFQICLHLPLPFSPHSKDHALQWGSESSPVPTLLHERTPQQQHSATAYSPHTLQCSTGPSKPIPPIQHHTSQSGPPPVASSSTAQGTSVPTAPAIISAFFVILSGWSPGVYMAL